MTKNAPGRRRARARADPLKLLLSVALLIGLPPWARAQTPSEADAASSAIAGNPGAVNIVAGTGELGRLLGLDPESGLRLGGVLVSNGNYLISGGNAPGTTSFNNLLLTDLDADLDKLAHIPGASFGAALLRFDGQLSNQQAGVVTGYNGLTGAPPLHRTELYELWWRQSLFSDTLMVRIGKTVPTYDFGNVVRPVPVQDLSLRIPGVSGLLYTPIFVNPTILGALPGYYNSAYGVTATVAPTERFYLSLGGYDGNVARREQTGLQLAPTFNGYRFQIGEAGTGWLLGPDSLLGAFAIGAWDQTGMLSTPQGITQNGTHGGYTFASQRLWRGERDGDSRGISGFVQLGANNSRTILATRYVGLGVTAFGMVPGRPMDSLGAGVAWSRLNHNPDLRPAEALLQFYDQIELFGSVYLQPTLTLSPNPGEKTARAPAIAFTLQSTVLF
ncbi:MAG TPA: carbohydrate porin [Stellaceae bacterium]